MIGDAIADNMDDLPLLLKPPPHRDHRSRHDLTPVEFEPVGPEDTVGDSGLVFDRYEQDALRGARTLAHKDHAGHFDVSAIADVREIDAANDRSEAHTSELQSLMRNSYAVFCLKKKKQ